MRARFPQASSFSEPLGASFQECDHSNNERLEGAEIEEFLRRLLKRPELEEIFHRYSGEDRVLSAPELLEFLEDQREDGATLAHAQKLIHTYELNETGGGLQVGADRRGRGQHGPVSASDRSGGFQLQLLAMGAILGGSPLAPRDAAATPVTWHSSIPASRGLAED